ncbi:MAG: class I SAM-dependent methyltransferase [Oscillatoriales cyanobacterium SM2_1_8]|nr:class I SAM-dependent methyltransferase [Oscillatoriales cyanobacterium SM2_1_8]
MKNAIKRLMHFCFRVGQRLGVDLLPRHFYSEIPDLRKLKRTTAWKQPYSLIGIAGADIGEQAAFVRSLVPPPLVERLARGDIHRSACEHNGVPGYGPIEADCLFAFVHTLRPPRIVQIGCGVSTAVCLMAAQEAGYTPQIVCIEPYPNVFLKSAAAAGSIRLIASPVEDLTPDEALAGLTGGDLFFVDSSHTLGPAGEVSRIILELLPRLPDGCFVHFHDIYFPFDYAGDILTRALFFWHESALLQAFLTLNSRFRLLAALSHLHFADQATLRDVFRNYQPSGNDQGLFTSPGHFPSSTYLKANG